VFTVIYTKFWDWGADDISLVASSANREDKGAGGQGLQPLQLPPLQ